MGEGNGNPLQYLCHENPMDSTKRQKDTTPEDEPLRSEGVQCAFDCVDHSKLWHVLKEMGVPDHLTCLLRNLYAGQEATVRTGHGTTDWLKIEKGVRQGCILSPCLFNLDAEHIMRKAGLNESPVGIKIAGRNINNLRYADDTTLMAESEEEPKSLLMRVKEESAKVGLKLNTKKTKIMASDPLTSWQIDGEEMELCFILIPPLDLKDEMDGLKTPNKNDIEVHQGSSSLLSKLIKQSYYGSVDTVPLRGVTPVQMLLEIGVDKMKRDYVSYFVGKEFAIRTHLDYFMSTSVDLQEQIHRVQKLHHMLEIVDNCVELLKLEHESLIFLTHGAVTVADISPESVDGQQLPSSCRSCINYYKENPLNEKHVFQLPVRATLVKEFYQNAHPQVWRVEISSGRGQGKVTTAWQLSTTPPAEHLCSSGAGEPSRWSEVRRRTYILDTEACGSKEEMSFVTLLDSTWHLMAKNSEDLKKRIVALHKDGLGYQKIAKTLKLSCRPVAKTTQRFNRTGSTQNRPRHGRPKKLSVRAQHHIQRLALGNGRMSAASTAAEVEGVVGQPVSAQTVRRTLHQTGLQGCRPRRKPLLKMMHKKARKQFAEDKQTKDVD
ncbi:hypothetical protein EYD10_13812 [Varanus komodoensis]|nr:hypothetical protein EYD10_13812 [Varanus komodoensis]